MAGTDSEDRSSDVARIAALDDLAILDTEPEVGFDDIVLLAGAVCGTPVALVSLVAEDRQWFKARVGFPACETPLSQSVCSLALRQGGTFAIPDLALDERTKGSPLVAGHPFIRFYAGAPFRTREGVPVGMLCVIDTEPRPAGLSEAQTRGLEALARQVEAQLELRRLLAERAGAAAERLAMEAAGKRHQELLSLELGHRLKNILALVHSIADRTLRGAEVPAEARSALLLRIRALGKAQDILLAGSAEAERAGRPDARPGAARTIHQRGQVRRAVVAGGHGGHRVVRRRGPRRTRRRTGLARGRRPRGRAAAARRLRHAPDRAGLGGDGRRHRHAGIPARRSGLPDRGAAFRLLAPRGVIIPPPAHDADRTPGWHGADNPAARHKVRG
jgi:GAF domain-containing protein